MVIQALEKSASANFVRILKAQIERIQLGDDLKPFLDMFSDYLA